MALQPNPLAQQLSQALRSSMDAYGADVAGSSAMAAAFHQVPIDWAADPGIHNSRVVQMPQAAAYQGAAELPAELIIYDSWVAQLLHTTSNLKLAASPYDLPRTGMQGILDVAPYPGTVLAATSALRPGCTLLTLDSLSLAALTQPAAGPPGAAADVVPAGGLEGAPAGPSAPPPGGAAEQLAAALLAGPHGDFFRSQPEFSISSGAQTASVRLGVVVATAAIAPHQAAMPRLRPFAAVCTAPLRLSSAEPMAADGTLNCRIHGSAVRSRPLNRPGIAAL